MRLYEATSIFSDNLDEIIVAVSSNLEYNINEFKHKHSKLSDWHASLSQKENEVITLLQDLVTYNFIQNMYGNQIRMLRNLIMVRKNKNSPRRTNIITTETIERAKEYPIEELYIGKLQTSGKSLIGICPFHTEKTRSFFIKKSNNRFKCFGCGASGDVIDFYIKTTDKKFREAVIFLSRT